MGLFLALLLRLVWAESGVVRFSGLVLHCLLTFVFCFSLFLKYCHVGGSVSVFMHTETLLYTGASWTNEKMA